MIINAAQPAVDSAQFAESQIISWLREHPPYQSRAISVAIGDEYQHGDKELEHWFGQMLFDTLEFAAFPYAVRCSLVELRKTVGEDAFNTVDWSVVRAALLPDEEASL